MTEKRDDDIDSSEEIYGRAKGVGMIGMPVVEESGYTKRVEVDSNTPTVTTTVIEEHSDIDDSDYDSLYEFNQPAQTKEAGINQMPGDELYVSPETLEDAENAKTNSLSTVMGTPKARIGIAAGVITTLLIIGGLAMAMGGDDKKLATNESGQAGIELKNDPNAPVNEAQARHQMQNAQGEAIDLANKGVTNAPVLATASAPASTSQLGATDPNLIAEKWKGTNYRTAEIAKIPENERLVYANTQAVNGQRDAYYDENLGNTALYTPQETRGGEVLTYSNNGITIRPADYPQRLERAIKAENSNQSAQNNGNNGNAGNGATQSNQGDPVFDTTKQNLANDYDVWAQNQAMQQQAIDAQRNAAQQAAATAAQNRQQTAKNSLSEALSILNRNNSSTYSAQIYGEKYRPLLAGTSFASSASMGTGSNANTTSISTKAALLPKNIIRAGTIFPIVVSNTVNSDYGTTVVASVAGGPFSGSKVFGQIERQGRNIAVSFTSLQPKNPRQPLIPINAIALTFAGQQGVASKVNRHYLQNYLTMLAQSSIQGYGAAYANGDTTTSMNNQGVVVTSTKSGSAQQVRGQILSALSERLNNDIGLFAERQPTYIIYQGSPLNMTLIDNVDTTATTTSISRGNAQGISNSGNTSTRN